jgi:hypothetical protein
MNKLILFSLAVCVHSFFYVFIYVIFYLLSLGLPLPLFSPSGFNIALVSRFFQPGGLDLFNYPDLRLVS